MVGIDAIKQLVNKLTLAVTQRRQRKLAAIAEIERRERELLVKSLLIKFAKAHADCEQDHKKALPVQLSFKEILLIERDLHTWDRHFKQRKIFEPTAKR